MSILLLLIPLSLVLLVVAVWAFVWAVRKGQFDDLDTPALDILREDDPPVRAAPEREEPPRDAG
ncbi:cbb3-type cytochrome oxidase assembly protein CcoS [Thermomonas flagellata]|uniref:cbb3-type cytochrome oxidase assembly protein CcoS n=1 Tax=Thermomonas flagellata TaxID=2888524 RepID=UPI001F037E03|nr:cbb3-type cytochrome oxidase assembly protein CcoS [Thermomonas flagellata]